MSTFMPAARATVEEGCNPIGEITLIKKVADRDEIHRRRRTGGEIIADRRDLDTVQCGVEAERGEGVAIDLGRVLRGSPCARPTRAY